MPCVSRFPGQKFGARAGNPLLHIDNIGKPGAECTYFTTIQSSITTASSPVV